MPVKSCVFGNFPQSREPGAGQVTYNRFQGTPPKLHDTQGCITSGLATAEWATIRPELRRVPHSPSHNACIALKSSFDKQTWNLDP